MNSSVRFLAPFMIHEDLPSLTETAFGSHPRCVVSIGYAKPKSFHGDNTGSNPVGDANHSKAVFSAPNVSSVLIPHDGTGSLTVQSDQKSGKAVGTKIEFSALLFLVQLLRQVASNAHFLDGVKLGVEKICVAFLILEHALK